MAEIRATRGGSGVSSAETTIGAPKAKTVIQTGRNRILVLKEFIIRPLSIKTFSIVFCANGIATQNHLARMFRKQVGYLQEKTHHCIGSKP